MLNWFPQPCWNWKHNAIHLRSGEHGEQILAQATSIVIVNEQIEQRSRHFVRMGIKIMDALHLAAAEAAGADYFCTCDDRFLRRAKSIANLQTNVVSPLELIEMIEA